MSQAEVANLVNKLVDMLMDEGVDSFDILEALDLTDYEKSYCGLDWLR